MFFNCELSLSRAVAAFPVPAGWAMTAGYQALHERAAWIDLSDRGKIRVTGEDRARLLHAMTTQQVQQMVPGDGTYVFFLNAQGRILADANLFCFEDFFLLDTEPETGRKLFEHLDRYIIADDVTLEDVTATMATIAVEGPEAEAVLRGLGAPLPERDYSTVVWKETQEKDNSGPASSEKVNPEKVSPENVNPGKDRVIARVNSTGAGGFFLFLPVAAKAELIAALGPRQAAVESASPADARMIRIEHGRPRYGEEITERFLVQETGQLQAVNFNKGCYLGQEIVERIRSRAQIHRVLRPLQIDTAEVPSAGQKIKASPASKAAGDSKAAAQATPEASAQTAEGQVAEVDAGEIVSAAFSPALGKVVAMAYMKIAFSEPGTQLHLGDATVHVG